MFFPCSAVLSDQVFGLAVRLRDIENTFRYSRVVTNPWRAATARSSEAGTLIPLRLRRGGQLWIRSHTSDIRVFSDVFVKDVYRLSAIGASTGHRLESVVDIGGHIGVFSSRAAGLAGRVIACEPMAENAVLFRRNVEGRENVSLLEQAVSGSGGEVTLFTSENTAGHTALPGLPEAQARATTVSSTTLAGIFERFELDVCSLLKIDCEGGEYEILFGATGELLTRVERMAMEYHNPGSERPRDSGEELERFLVGHGFAVDRVPSKRHANYGLLYAWRTPAW